jgi:hypothetical protein
MSESTSLHELRTLLLGDDFRTAEEVLAEIKARIEILETQVTTEGLSLRLPELVNVSQSQSQTGLSKALAPIIGPAISAAVVETLASWRAMLEEVIERASGFKSLCWRYQAWTTNRPYGEIVLINTFQYHVLTAYLLRRDSGMLVNAISESKRFAVNGVSYAGMLSALKDFAKVCLKGDVAKKSPAAGFSFRYEGYTCLVGDSDNFTLALLIQGDGHAAVQSVLKNALAEVEEWFAEAPFEDTGDMSLYAPTEIILRRCMVGKRESEKSKQGGYFGRTILTMVVATLGGLLVWNMWKQSEKNATEARIFKDWLSQVKHFSGAILESVENNEGKWFVRVSKDPDESRSLPVVPAEISEKVEVTEKATLVDHSELTLVRTKRILQAPPTVFLHDNQGMLSLRGEADSEWIKKAKLLTPAIYGVKAADYTSLKSFEQKKFDAMVLGLRHKVQGSFQNIKEIELIFNDIIVSINPGYFVFILNYYHQRFREQS